MALARYNGTIQDLLGNAVAGGQVLVIREGGAVEQLYSDRAGTVPTDNPVVPASDGSFWFHTQGGAFRFVITAPGLGTREVRYVGIGIASESDVQGLTPRGLYSAATTYEIGDMVKHGNYLFASRVDDNLNHTPDSVDPPGDTTEWMYLGPIAGTTVDDVLDELGVHSITISEDNPSGGIDGDLWIKVTP